MMGRANGQGQEESHGQNQSQSAEEYAPPGLVAINVKDLITKTFSPREHVMEPWLPTQGIALAHGIRGVGKTQFSIGVSVAIATGTPFWKWKVQKPRRVLFIDGEMPVVALRDRVGAALRRTGEPPFDHDYLRFITPDLQEVPIPDLSEPHTQELLLAMIERDKIDQVVLDNLSTLCPAGKENEAESWGPMQAWALRLRRIGVSTLFIHHSGRNGLQRGTSKREDVIDTEITLRRPADYQPTEGARFEVHFTKSRGFSGEDAEPFEAALVGAELGEEVWAIRSLADVRLARSAALYAEGYSVREVAKELGVSHATAHRLRPRSNAGNGGAKKPAG
jgi:putative DNA primase/helicase